LFEKSKRVDTKMRNNTFKAGGGPRYTGVPGCGDTKEIAWDIKGVITSRKPDRYLRRRSLKDVAGSGGESDGIEVSRKKLIDKFLGEIFKESGSGNGKQKSFYKGINGMVATEGGGAKSWFCAGWKALRQADGQVFDKKE